ncbi:MAG: type I restriction endonuclease [Nitrosopumilus sp.]
MNEILKEIREYLKKGHFTNEESIRLSLVARVLQKLDWDIWNPREFFTEYPVVPHEDSTRVDIALFENPFSPSVFIETKSINKLASNFTKYEIQLRDYNRNNTALFSIITDGRIWRFYYSQTGGEFSQKCFKVLDFVNDDLEDIELSLYAFLSKEEIRNGNAKKEAETYLRLNQKQRAMEDVLAQARRLVLEPPFPSLPQAIVESVKKTGLIVTDEDAINFIELQRYKKVPERKPPVSIIKHTHNIDKRTKTPTPSVRDWLMKIPDLKSVQNLNSWRSICDYLKIDVGSDSARRKLNKWIKENRPEWPDIPEPK